MKILKTIFQIVALLALFILTLSLFMVIVYFATELIVGENYFFYEYDQVAYQFLGLLVIFPPLIVTIFLATKLKLVSSMRKAEKNEEIIYFWNRLGAWKFLVGFIYFVILFITISSVNVVYSDKIVTKSFLNLKGTEYHFSEVEEINCGFGKSNFSFLDYKQKGSFYYQVKLDGKTITFCQPTPNTEDNLFGEDTYLELELFDKSLMLYSIPKNSSSEGVEHCDFDQVYIDRFLRIINNK